MIAASVPLSEKCTYMLLAGVFFGGLVNGVVLYLRLGDPKSLTVFAPCISLIFPTVFFTHLLPMILTWLTTQSFSRSLRPCMQVMLRHAQPTPLVSTRL